MKIKLSISETEGVDESWQRRSFKDAKVRKDMTWIAKLEVEISAIKWQHDRDAWLEEVNKNGKDSTCKDF